MTKLIKIEGIGEAFAQKLKGAGVGSVEMLLRKGGTKKGRQDLSEKSGLDSTRRLRGVNHADLMRIKGIGGEYAELLEASGVDTVKELAQRNSINCALGSIRRYNGIRMVHGSVNVSGSSMVAKICAPSSS